MIGFRWSLLGAVILFLFLFVGCTKPSPNSMESTEKKPTNVVQSQEDSHKEELPWSEDYFIQYFLKGNFEPIYEHTNAELQEEVPLKDLRELSLPFNEGVSQYKLESKIEVEGGTKYIWIDDQGEKAVSAVFDDRKIITGLWINLITSYPETDQIFTQNTYRFPFNGEWMTSWGGTNEIVNYHYPNPKHRYAYDFIKVKDSMSYKGDPDKNESYFAYGEEVIAPADGIVVAIQDGLMDNSPVGRMNPFYPFGNYIILEHANGEFSLIAHLKYESILVLVGDEVQQGDILGLAGNSGNSSEPHIHFHIMDSADLEEANSIRIRFENQVEVIQGDLVQNNL